MPEIRRPCSDCPWRRDAPAGFWDPEHFREIWRNCQDDGYSTMLCHGAAKLPRGQERNRMVCQGWVRSLGFDSIGVRMAHRRGFVRLAEIEDVYGPALFSFAEMLAHNGVVPPPRNRVKP